MGADQYTDQVVSLADQLYCGVDLYGEVIDYNNVEYQDVVIQHPELHHATVSA